MEALFLLFSIVSTFFTSSLLSLYLALRSLLSLLTLPFSPPPHTPDDALILYEGEVWHQRRHPILHFFKYTVRYALIDLDRSPSSLRLHHMSAEQARRLAGTTGPVVCTGLSDPLPVFLVITSGYKELYLPSLVAKPLVALGLLNLLSAAVRVDHCWKACGYFMFLLTIPSSVGYEQNPLSVYYCYEQEGSAKCLKICIAEVTNTPWGERVSFVFNPGSDLVAKPLHVSPFMDMLGNWSMLANAPGERLFLKILVHHPMHGNYFTATLNAKRVSSSSWPINPALFFWLVPQKVAIWIYWQAFKLWWKNISFVHHPRYLNQRYREEASMRDEKLQCCQNIEPNKERINRCFVWRDAQWPWA